MQFILNYSEFDQKNIFLYFTLYREGVRDIYKYLIIELWLTSLILLIRGVSIFIGMGGYAFFAET